MLGEVDLGYKHIFIDEYYRLQNAYAVKYIYENILIILKN